MFSYCRNVLIAIMACFSITLVCISCSNNKPEIENKGAALSVPLLSKPEMIFIVQTELKELGYYTGLPDKQLSTQTQDAMVAFNRDNGLDEKVEIDQEYVDTVKGAGPFLDFRGAKFLGPPTKDMKRIKLDDWLSPPFTESDRHVRYERRNEKLSLGNIPLHRISYYYFDRKLYMVKIDGAGGFNGMVSKDWFAEERDTIKDILMQKYKERMKSPYGNANYGFDFGGKRHEYLSIGTIRAGIHDVDVQFYEEINEGGSGERKILLTDKTLEAQAEAYDKGISKQRELAAAEQRKKSIHDAGKDL